MDLGLRDRVVLVTGASGDIGAAIARAFAAEHATLALTWHTNRDRADALVEEITGAGGRAVAVRVDQRDESSVHQAIADVERELGEIDVLVANAVTWPTARTDTRETLIDGLTSNVAGTMATIERALPGMRRAGWGRVVVISTDIVEQPLPAGVAYPAAKAALESAARVLATREARHGVLTNVVRPGFTLTERALTSPGLGQEAVDSESAKTPTLRICTPEDVAALTVFLGSAANSHVNGEAVSVAGGRHLTR
ncbi:SDR family oxidoreductase [Allokutzneria sp. A3M-2-11 16]|uniref:SDR family NAD(P)-dependent oxidoreductase n=1 Tax=Allokutzneria sp. A3M-2-11 16 TaxID=2962043 RepID=UPI0020B7844D|nr:SDR family oxidoreductase [Allokutzneria sp. A3M-2-11 16]MCP3803454.1 SDR family oxidoreductase [Allokutzneria sp. A3M-2-11 16]